jgi:DNA-binding XRE family transcriptional regulator
MYNIITGKDLRTMRVIADKTTSEMAKFAGVKTRKTYENWEKEVGQPKVNQWLQMARCCGYQPDLLVEQFVERGDLQDPKVIDYELTRRRN